MKTMTHKEWLELGHRLFGSDIELWKFACPVCHYIQSVAECRAAGMPEEAIGFSCVGRWRKDARDAFEGSGLGPCNYAGGGLFKLNPIEVITEEGGRITVFEFEGEKAC